MTQTHTAAKTNSTICAKSTHESYRKGGKNYRPFDASRRLAPKHSPRDMWRIDSASVHRLQSRFSLSRAGQLRRVRIADVRVSGGMGP